MTKTGWIVAIVVLLAVAGIGFALYVGMKSSPAPVVEVAPVVIPSETSDSPTQLPPAAETVVTYTDSGFAPKIATVAVGTTVRFVNTSTHGMWVGSDDHPTHTKYDGTSTKEHCASGVNTNGTFDGCVAVAPGTVYNFTFTKAGTFTYHNHTKSGDTGTVVVK